MHARLPGYLITLLAVLVVLSGCSWLPGTTQASTPKPERESLRVGVTSAIDTAPLRIAVAQGAFARAGLRVHLVELPDPGQGLAQLRSGQVDVTFGSDVELFRAAASGTALRLEAEAYTAGENSMALVRPPNSGYVEPMLQKAPVIGVDRPDGLGTLTTRSVLATADVDPADIRFVVREPAELTAALRRGDIDAAWLTEPYITEAAREFGATILTDCARGATAGLPMSGYASGTPFADANPRTLGLFRQVLGEAQQRAVADPTAIRHALPTFSGIDTTTAALVSLGTYPTSLNGVRLQRVADLMHSSGLLDRRLDVASLLPPGPSQPR